MNETKHSSILTVILIFTVGILIAVIILFLSANENKTLPSQFTAQQTHFSKWQKNVKQSTQGTQQAIEEIRRTKILLEKTSRELNLKEPTKKAGEIGKQQEEILKKIKEIKSKLPKK